MCLANIGRHDTMNKTPSYYQGVNTLLLKYIPANLQHLLEFGCAEGRLGAAYKHENPGACWYGMDIHQPAVKAAQTRIDYAACASANQPIVDELIWQHQYDCLVYGDVIEHLINPQDSIRLHLEMLKPGGYLITCLPNIEHWSTFHELLSGRWEYQQEGLMDNTHLRFFTLASATRMFERLGLTVTSTKPVIPKQGAALINNWDQYQNVVDDLTVLQRKYNGGENLERLRAYQYIIVTQKSS